ncbi:PH domain-containing protein [Paludibacterium paludis]|uniref:Uncharacterized protein n=1 Tax=Paludibacterium paludis TaxID=1225769 RepID=A0A918NX91_9NEIS|nr:PH domain-containing protein [Paludibacterium paludis]GGY03681.1 hypothetical protein GCM10011289_02520 [Paludibacterium paludis]
MAFDYKNASPEALKNEYRRIAQAIGDDQFFTKKELAHLPAVLADGEQILAFCSGLMDSSTWLITLTDQRIIFLDKGLLFGLKQSAIDLDKVNAISGETGVFFGKISIQDGASNRTIDNVPKRTVVPFTNLVRDAINNRKHGKHTIGAAQADDPVARLEKLSAMLSKGLITEAEFTEQKARILQSV